MKHAYFVLVILDGFGFSDSSKGNAIAQARTPFFDEILKKYPHTLLKASGQSVGLMPDQPGNSEVGHLTIGAGRRIESDLIRINRSIEDGSFFSNETLKNSLGRLSNGSTLHLMGLLSDGRVHSYLPHVKALLQAAKKYGIKNVMIHAFLDGRDTPPRSAEIYLRQLDSYCAQIGIGSVGSIQGRYYPMDRDLHWERTQESYNALTEIENTRFQNWQAALNFFYSSGISDEFIPPTQFEAMRCIKKNDGIIFFNYRADRAHQLTRMFLDASFNQNERSIIPFSFFCTMTNYGLPLPARPLFLKNVVQATLKEALAEQGKKIFSIAETEKYAHITYFFNGQQEAAVKDEVRVLIPSPNERSFAHSPCMSAPLITQTVIQALNENYYDFYLINYANADMVGHSGDLNATIKAIECLDNELKKLWHAVQHAGGILCITADHGKAEQMIDEKTGQSMTSHTINPVYFIYLSDESRPRSLDQLHELADIAPWILKFN